MGLDQKFIEANNNDRNIDMRKLYPVHRFFVNDNNHVVGEIHLDAQKVEELINYLNRFVKNASDMSQIAKRFANIRRDHMDIDEVQHVLNWLQQIEKSEDTLLVYIFNS